MSLTDYLIILAGCSITILLCRVIPLFVLKGRELKPQTIHVLQMIPVAAFAALVTNDLFKPDLWAQGVWNGAMPLLAAAVVAWIAVKTKNLLVCALAGVGVYALLMLV
ncbi:MAG: AzlD domain-containing protein [Eggerthellaceae bacterium]